MSMGKRKVTPSSVQGARVGASPLFILPTLVYPTQRSDASDLRVQRWLCMTHLTSSLLWQVPSRSMICRAQQSLAPPGKFEQPPPAHPPQDCGQQTPRAAMPLEQKLCREYVTAKLASMFSVVTRESCHRAAGSPAHCALNSRRVPRATPCGFRQRDGLPAERRRTPEVQVANESKVIGGDDG